MVYQQVDIASSEVWGDGVAPLHGLVAVSQYAWLQPIQNTKQETY